MHENVPATAVVVAVVVVSGQIRAVVSGSAEEDSSPLTVGVLARI